MRVSLIIASFQRAQLLHWNLVSLARQNFPDEMETLVVNDGLPDETEAVCAPFQARLNLKYLFVGQRNLAGTLHWRVPGFAYNIGARQSSGTILIICCAEMFHVNDTVAQLVAAVCANCKNLAIPFGKDDRDGYALQAVIAQNGGFDPQLFPQYIDLDTHLPFLLAVGREEFFKIGGFDEDFTGIAFDDNDLVERLQKNGCCYCQTEARAIHLYHPRYMYEVGMNDQWHYNRNLYMARGNRIIRNQNREWGKL
ncbi:MAG: glycosyltransferase [Bacillota bacterium]